MGLERRHRAPLLSAEDCASNNGTKATPCLCADILGDWREEVLWRSADNRELRIYTTTIPTEHRLPTLMHDPQYRLSVAWQNVGYNQPTQPGFYLGDGMVAPPRPRIRTPERAAPDSASSDHPGKRRPHLDLIGDSTVRNRTRGQQGWGDPFVNLFDPSRIQVENRALGGRSSRTYLTEGLWERVRDDLEPGDFVLIQFGHNDGGPLDRGRARASLKGNGDETRVVTNQATGKTETVHTYGWYIRKYVADAREKGATPIVLSPVPRNIWKDGRVARASGDYGRWAAQAAEQAGARFIDLNELVARQYEAAGPEHVKEQYFGNDHTHTTAAGERLTAGIVAEAIRSLDDCPLRNVLRQGSPK